MHSSRRMKSRFLFPQSLPPPSGFLSYFSTDALHESCLGPPEEHPGTLTVYTPGLYLHKGQKGKQSSFRIWLSSSQLVSGPETVVLDSSSWNFSPKYQIHWKQHMTLNMSTSSCQVVPLQSQVTSHSPARLHGPWKEQPGALRKHCQTSQAHCWALQSLKQAPMEGQGEQGAECMMPLITTEICSSRGWQMQESPL